MSIARRGLLGFLAAFVAGGGLGASATEAPGRDLVVFAAASLKNALDDLKAEGLKATGGRVTVSYGGSNALAKQIEQGAPADLFISADRDWMDYAEARGLLRPNSRADLVGNRLVLVSPRADPVSLELRPGIDLLTALKGGRLAVANVDAVPAGKYGKAALERLGAWEGVKTRIAATENVRAALRLVSRGEAPLGIVYATDAVADPDVEVVATFPDDTHPPIVYPAAIVAASSNPDADAFLGYLRSTAARTPFERQGFKPLGPAASGS